MSSFLIKKRNNKSFEESISTPSIQTQRNIRYAINLFEDFITEQYKKTAEQDIKVYLNFTKRTREERHPLSQDEYRKKF